MTNGTIETKDIILYEVLQLLQNCDCNTIINISNIVNLTFRSIIDKPINKAKVDINP